MEGAEIVEMCQERMVGVIEDTAPDWERMVKEMEGAKMGREMPVDRATDCKAAT
jgi:hypothetical protein